MLGIVVFGFVLEALHKARAGRENLEFDLLQNLPCLLQGQRLCLGGFAIGEVVNGPIDSPQSRADSKIDV